MSEATFSKAVQRLLTGHGFSVQSHEDMNVKFIPDLSFGYKKIDGWIELKWVPGKLPQTLGHIPHYTYGQQEWLTRRGAKGSGHCYLLVGSGHGCFLWKWSALTAARDMPWAEAAGLALYEEDIGAMCRAMAAVVHARGRY